MRALIALAMLLLAVPAHAQQVCGPRDEIVARLFLLHDEIKSFSIIITHPDGTSCLAMVGHRWRYVSDKGV